MHDSANEIHGSQIGLDQEDNHISYDAVKVLVNTLPRCTLTSLNLGGNHIGTAGAASTDASGQQATPVASESPQPTRP
jgi:hypothetical protein